MTPSSLIRWSKLEEKRRRDASSGLVALPPWVWSVVVGIMLFAEGARRLATAEGLELIEGAVSTSRLWVAACIGGYALSVFGAPFRLYWRRDSKILASLPLPGRSLFRLCLYRSATSAAWISLAMLIAALPLAIWVDGELFARHLLLVLIGSAGALCLAPAAALGAGAIVASDRAQAMIASMGGEFQAPRTSWLGILPGSAAAAVGAALAGASMWALGGRPPGGSIELFAGLSIALPVAALAWAMGRADEVVPAAIREVSALDQEILAHVERSDESPSERAFFSALLGSSRARLIARKDAVLMRRRYPSPYFLIPMGIAALWIVALTRPDNYLPWTGPIVLVLAAYSVIMARRSTVPPIEIDGLLETLAISAGDVSRGKRVHLYLRLLWIGLAGGVPVILRAHDQLSAAVLVVGSLVVALVLGRALTSR